MSVPVSWNVAFTARIILPHNQSVADRSKYRYIVSLQHEIFETQPMSTFSAPPGPPYPKSALDVRGGYCDYRNRTNGLKTD